MQAIKTGNDPVIVFIRRDAADKLRELAKSGELAKTNEVTRVDWTNQIVRSDELKKAKEWLINNAKDGIAPSMREFANENMAFLGALQEAKFPDVGRTYTAFVKFTGLRNKYFFRMDWANQKIKDKQLARGIEWIKVNSKDGIAPSSHEFAKKCGPLNTALITGKFPDIGKKYTDILRHIGLKTKSHSNIDWKDDATRIKILADAAMWIKGNSKESIAPSQEMFQKAFNPLSNALTLGKFPEVGKKYSDFVNYLGLKNRNLDWSDEKMKDQVKEEAIRWINDNSIDKIAPSVTEFRKKNMAFMGALSEGLYPSIGLTYRAFLKSINFKSREDWKIDWSSYKNKEKQLKLAIKWLTDNSQNGETPSMREFQKENQAFFSALKSGYFPEIGKRYRDLLKHAGINRVFNTEWKKEEVRNEILTKTIEWIKSNSKNGVAPSATEFAKKYPNFYKALLIGYYPKIGKSYSDLAKYIDLKSRRR